MSVGASNIINKHLVSRDNIILPPLHIKLGLMKQYVKALNKHGDCFKCICRKFPGLSIDKLKQGIFDGPQIRQLINDSEFVKSMTVLEFSAWNSFVLVVKNFLGNFKAENLMELVENMLSNFREIGANMSIKIHYLFSHLDCFPRNLGNYSEEQGERFDQDFKTMEERYQGTWDDHMMACYCWNLMRDCSGTKHRRKSYKRRLCVD